MYKILHNIDNEKVTTLRSDEEFVRFARKIAEENEDNEISILNIVEAKNYLANYCPNLTLLN